MILTESQKFLLHLHVRKFCGYREKYSCQRIADF